ncbi:MAG: YihY/virulence factor BrkB family protein [Deltaproteobacteria bacterium]|nr:YihY/virulence factor BrkB family protein [Deltaproteobacteria bacterium]
MKNPFDYVYFLYKRIDQSGLTNWPLLAAALSYYSALAVVPILAICFAIAKSLGLEEALYLSLKENFGGQEAILKLLMGFAENLIKNFSGSILVFSALAFIFWSVYGLLWQLEINFSRIFGYFSDRNAIRRATDYLTIMLIIPFFLLAAGSVNIFLASIDNQTFFARFPQFQVLPLHTTIMVLFPVLIWWFILSWTYAYFSRGLIGWRERLIGGFITGLIFQTFQKFYLKIIISITSYNAIYGSFAVVPLFMVWLYISWIIVIFGGEFTRRLADFFLSGLKVSAILIPITWLELKQLSVKVIEEISAAYQNPTEPKGTGLLTLAKRLKTPLPHLGKAVNCLQKSGLILRVAAPDNDDGPVFVPAIAPNNLDRDKISVTLEKILPATDGTL